MMTNKQRLMYQEFTSRFRWRVSITTQYGNEKFLHVCYYQNNKSSTKLIKDLLEIREEDESKFHTVIYDLWKRKLL